MLSTFTTGSFNRFHLLALTIKVTAKYFCPLLLPIIY